MGNNAKAAVWYSVAILLAVVTAMIYFDLKKREQAEKARLQSGLVALTQDYLLSTDATAVIDFSNPNISNDWNATLDIMEFSDDLTLNRNYTGKITCEREPVVTAKPDGRWEITFAP